MHYLTGENSRHYMQADLLCYIVIYFAMEKWLTQTQCISYSTMIDSVLLHYLTSEKCRHYVLVNLLFKIWIVFVI